MTEQKNLQETVETALTTETSYFLEVVAEKKGKAHPMLPASFLKVRVAVMGLALCCASAMASAPYQLCQIQAKGAIEPEHNYRFSKSTTQRQVTDIVLGRCDRPMLEVVQVIPGCEYRFGDGGYDGPEPKQKQNGTWFDGEGWWLDVSITRSYSPDNQQGFQKSSWSPNVEMHSNFSLKRLDELYRWWPWNLPRAIVQQRGFETVNVGGGHYPRCFTMAYLFGFFNGVWNTRTEAEESLRQMKRENFLGLKWREAPVRYELFYNQTCKRSADDVCLQDVAEVFRQRSAELDGLLARRWEYFWEQVTGQRDQPGSFTQRLLDRLARSDNALASWFDGLYNAVLAKITALSALLAKNPPTAEDTAAHTAQLIAAGQGAERAVLVAHSQGNLFVNAAYDAYLAHSRQVGRALGQDTNYVAAQVVHIAPASATLRGPYVLADIDIVINGLRRVDGTYLAASNFSLARDAKDASGHKLLATYLDEARPARAHILQLIQQGLDAL